MDIEKKKSSIRPLAPNQLQTLQNFAVVDNAFRGLIKHEDEIKMNVDGARRFLHDIKKNRNMLDDFLVPTGNGMLQKLRTPTAKKDYINNINKNLKMLENQYAGILEQHAHKADEYGEAIIHIYKTMASMLKFYYGFTDESLTYLLQERGNAVDIRRPKEELADDIKKALEE